MRMWLVEKMRMLSDHYLIIMLRIFIIHIENGSGYKSQRQSEAMQNKVERSEATSNAHVIVGM